MKKIDRIKTKKELTEWIMEKKKRLDEKVIRQFQDYHQELSNLEKKYRDKLGEMGE